MDIVLLLGAGAEPAQSIARRLVGLGSRVYGLSNKFPEQGFAHRDFIPVGVNPADPAAVRIEVEKIVAREGALGAVILAGHNPVEDAFESAHPNDVVLAIFAGLAAPLAAVRAAMPGLIKRRGLVLAVTRPVFGPGSALNGVVEAGLASFCDGLFGELRDTGVRVCHLRLQENAGPADPAARYTNTPQSRVQPDIVADTVEAVMRLRENNAITRLVLRPQATREEPKLPITAEPKLTSLQVVQLPTSRNYPPAEEKIFTPQYRRPDYAPPPEDGDRGEEDDDDEAVDPELAYLIKPRHRDRFVRDNAPAPAPSPAREVRGEEESGEESPADSAENEPESREAPRQEQRRQENRPTPAKQYHNPYDRTPPPQRGPRHGAVRIQAPNTNGDAEQRPRQQPQQQQQPRPQQAQQQQPRQQEGRPLRFEQMPRPRDWQGPRYPQGGIKPSREQQPGAPANAPRPVGSNGPDLHPKYREAQEQRLREQQEAGERENRPQETGSPQEARTRGMQPHQPRIFTDAQGRPVGGGAPAPAARPAPVIVPVEAKSEIDSKDAGDKNASGRSEAVTLSFGKKEEPAAAPKVTPKPTPAEKIVKAQRDEELDEAPLKVKKRPAPKKSSIKVKAPKEPEPSEDGEDDTPPPAPAAKPAKPKKKPAAKKSASDE